jgi:hypothetical protein
MIPGDDAPLIFERRAKSQFTGCVAYLLMVPVVAVVGGIVGGLIGAGLCKLCPPDKSLQLWLICTPAALLAIAALVWGIRDYIGRSANRISIYSDRLEFGREVRKRVIRFEDVAWTEGPSYRELKIQPTKGSMLVLQTEEWPIDDIGRAWVDRAVPILARAVARRLEAGEALEFRASSFLAVRLALSGLLLIAPAVFLIIRWFRMTREESSKYALALPIFLLSTGGATILSTLRASGAIVLSRHGARRRRGDAVIPWNRLRLLPPDPGGFVLEADDGTKIKVGSLIQNYPVCLAMVQAGLAEAK